MRPICSHYLCYCYVENHEISLLNNPLLRDKTNRTHRRYRVSSHLQDQFEGHAVWVSRHEFLRDGGERGQPALGRVPLDQSETRIAVT